MHFYYILLNYLPLEKGMPAPHPFLTNLNLFCQIMSCAKLSWIWQSGSEKNVKSLRSNKDNEDRQQTN